MKVMEITCRRYFSLFIADTVFFFLSCSLISYIKGQCKEGHWDIQCSFLVFNYCEMFIHCSSKKPAQERLTVSNFLCHQGRRNAQVGENSQDKR